MNLQMSALKSAAVLTTGAALWIGSAVAAPLPLAYPSNSGALFESVVRGQAPVDESDISLAPNHDHVATIAASVVPALRPSSD